MIIMYDFQAEDYEYEVEYEELKKVCLELFAENYDLPIEKSEQLLADDCISLERMEEEFEDELYARFESEAYKEYIDRRCE